MIKYLTNSINYRVFFNKLIYLIFNCFKNSFAIRHAMKKHTSKLS